MAAALDGVTDLQNVALQEALAAVWEAKKSKAEITDVADWLLKQKDDGDKNLGCMLYPFTNRGKYGKFFTSFAIWWFEAYWIKLKNFCLFEFWNE